MTKIRLTEWPTDWPCWLTAGLTDWRTWVIDKIFNKWRSNTNKKLQFISIKPNTTSNISDHIKKIFTLLLHDMFQVKRTNMLRFSTELDSNHVKCTICPCLLSAWWVCHSLCQTVLVCYLFVYHLPWRCFAKTMKSGNSESDVDS